MDDNDDSSIMGVGAGMTGDATRTGTGRAFGAAGTGVGTNTFSESTAAMGELLFLSDGKAQPNVPIFNKSAIGSSLSGSGAGVTAVDPIILATNT